MVKFLFSAILAAIFVTLATVKVELFRDSRRLHLDYCSNKLIRTIGEKQFLYFSLMGEGGQKPLNARSPLIFLLGDVLNPFGMMLDHVITHFSGYCRIR